MELNERREITNPQGRYVGDIMFTTVNYSPAPGRMGSRDAWLAIPLSRIEEAHPEETCPDFDTPEAAIAALINPA